MRYFYLFIILFTLHSCRSGADQQLEQALQFAGNNRTELEKVLEHYRDSGEKYLAARFLIENMPGHYSYVGPELDSLKALLSFAARQTNIPAEKKARWAGFSYTRLKKVHDAQVITSAYLIRHIDRIFALRDQRPWNRYLSFEDFCEFLLPYRVGNEPLEEWLPTYQQHYAPLLDSLYKGNDAVEACSALCEVLRNERFPYNNDFPLPHLGAKFLFGNRIGTCKESCDLTIYAMRSVGIPVMTDHYIFSPATRWGHTWNVLKDTTGKNIPFWFSEFSIKRGPTSDQRKKGKVYRKYYAWQPALVRDCQSDPDVPSVFRNLFLRDVSTEYFPSSTLSVPLSSTIKGKYAYLGVFHTSGWIPVAISTLHHNTVSFPDTEPEAVYHLLLKESNALQPHGYPFVFTRQGVRFFKPDTSQRHAVILTRKFPHTAELASKMNRMYKARIEGSLTPGFEHPVLLHVINDSIFKPVNTVHLPITSRIRYIRYTPPASIRFPSLAELQFFPDTFATTPHPFRVVNPENLIRPGKAPDIHDNDPLTLATLKMGQSLLLDMGSPRKIGKIVFVPQNDDNFIRPGDTYELFYNNGKNTWISLGSQTATTDTLCYKNVPANALLWLKDHTRGNEEQLFYCNNGQQIFP